MCADMDVKSSPSAKPRQQERDPSTTQTPFSPQLDADLASIILKLEHLYAEGKRTFVIVAHRDPDADAMAGCLGMDRLIRGLLPEDITIRWMHDGYLSDCLRKVCGGTTEPVAALPSVLEAAPQGSVAIVVVDQSGLHSSAVLPANLESDIQLKAREADVVLDHHGDPRHDPGMISAPEAGCTAALVYRLLELAKNSERFRDSCHSPDDEARLALLVNMGARTDASQQVVGPISDAVSPYVRWAVHTTEGRFDPAVCSSFDVLAGHHEGLVRHAQAHTKVYPNVVVNRVPARVLVAYAGIADSVHCIGACADRLLSGEKEREGLGQLPVAVVVCGVIQPPGASPGVLVHKGERIHVSVRTEKPIDAEYMAELISVHAGGRVGSAAAQLTVPEMCDDMPVDRYMLLLLSYIEMKLIWPPGSLWH